MPLAVVWTLLEAVRTQLEIQLLNIQKGINRTKIACSVPSFHIHNVQKEHEKQELSSS